MVAACELAPENINFLRDLASREKAVNTFTASINAYLRYIEILKAGLTEYFDYSNLASVYLELGDIYNNKYNADLGKVPTLPQPELDEDGHEIPLTSEQETELAATRARIEALNMIAEASKTEAFNLAVEAESYFQKALDNAPEELSNEGIANIKIGLAGAREARGDIEGALDYMKEARELNPANANYLVYMASLESSRGNDEKARELYIEARTMDPENLDIAYSYAQSLLYSDNPADSVVEMQAYRDALPEGHPNIERAEQAIATLQMYADFFASLKASNVEVDGHDHDHDHENEGADVVIEDDDIQQ